MGISRDIKPFYNVFKLDEDFWHLKLFLLKEELKADTLLLIAVIKTLINSNKSSVPLFDKVRPINHKLKPGLLITLMTLFLT